MVAAIWLLHTEVGDMLIHIERLNPEFKQLMDRKKQGEDITDEDVKKVLEHGGNTIY